MCPAHSNRIIIGSRELVSSIVFVRFSSSTRSALVIYNRYAFSSFVARGAHKRLIIVNIRLMAVALGDARRASGIYQ